MPSRIKTVRSNSAGYNHQVVDYCFENHLYFTITADHDMSVMERISRIGKNGWEKGKNEDGTDADYDIAETVHAMQKSREAFRLVIKRTDRGKQSDLFEGGYHYWIIATNVPREERDANSVIHFHNKRGEMERITLLISPTIPLRLFPTTYIGFQEAQIRLVPPNRSRLLCTTLA